MGNEKFLSPVEKKACDLREVIDESKIGEQEIGDEVEIGEQEISDEARAIKLKRKLLKAKGKGKLVKVFEYSKLLKELEKTADSNKIYNKDVIDAEIRSTNEIINNLGQNN